MHNVFVEEVNRRNKEFQEKWLREHKIVPVPKPGDKVSFPVACVTGVCFQISPSSFIFRWNADSNQLKFWTGSIWSISDTSVEWFTEVTVVEEPKPEPVWKDCNFIEAVEWMKKHRGESVARWRQCGFWLGSDGIYRNSDGERIRDVFGSCEEDYILGKWQIKVS